MTFYFSSVYYDVAKRISGIQYVRIAFMWSKVIVPTSLLGKDAPGEKPIFIMKIIINAQHNALSKAIKNKI